MSPAQRMAIALLLLVVISPEGIPAEGFERSESREACADHDPLRRPFFGDLHVHTRYSFDSITSGQRNGPRGAYRYAKGESIELPSAGGEAPIVARIRRPLDFAAVTDHAEFLGEMYLCNEDPWTLAYWTPLCVMTRVDSFFPQLFASSLWADRVSEDATHKNRAFSCRLSPSACRSGLRTLWTDLQVAAEEHYDRSSSCSFTTFVGYEYTDTPGLKNLHRNVIFRNDRVSELPVSSYETGARNVPELWRRLRVECNERVPGCDVLAIPHNPNLSGGLMFPDPADAEEARARRAFEPIAEIVQHKGASECRFDRLAGRGVFTADEFCDFEQNRTDNLGSLGVLFGEMQVESGAPVPIEDFGRRNLLRNVLKDGLVLERSLGIDPFRLGFIGSTDTHSAVAGGAMEDDYVGHLGRRDADWRNVQDHIEDNPGGLAVIWAEENARDALFEGMRRRETYATSGTRPRLRFFGGSDLPRDLCERKDFAATGYARGVPMGGEIQGEAGDVALRFAVRALKDTGTLEHPGTDLQRVQIVKGWLDESGNTHERVYDVAGGPNGASVNPENCARRGRGHASLCSVWEDPDFDPGEAAFYYLRVLENPTCRWSTLQCMAAGVNPFDASCASQAEKAGESLREQGARGEVYANCCLDPAERPFYTPVIQERAWSSPIWYRAASP